MNEDKMLALLSNLDDDLVEKEIDTLLEGVDFNRESIIQKTRQKMLQHNKKAHYKKHLSWVAAICACFICINTVYADDISAAFKKFFNKTPVYSTMVDGSAYYLKGKLVLDDNLTMDSCMVSEGWMDMELTSTLGADILEDTVVVPKSDSGVQYVMGGYSKDGNNQYTLLFMNGTENNYNIKPFKEFNLTVNDKTYTVSLEQADSLDAAQKISIGNAAGTPIDLVEVAANSLEKDGKKAVQLIALFKNPEMKLSAFGQPLDKTVKSTFENSDDGILSSSNRSLRADLYATDKNGNRHKLQVPADAKLTPVTSFITTAAADSELTLNIPALLATYQKKIDTVKISIPENGEQVINREIDMLAQKAEIKSIKRLSPTSAQILFQLNTGGEDTISIRSFNAYSQEVNQASAEFSGDTAAMILEFDKDTDEFNLEISWPEFLINGNWTIDLQ